MVDLKMMKCVSLTGKEPSLTYEEIGEYQTQVPGWEVIEKEGIKRLQRIYKFKNFTEALDFTNKIGTLAEEEDHHPVIQTEWGKVTLTWWTHVIKGLHQNDFIMAAKSDVIYSSK